MPIATSDIFCVANITAYNQFNCLDRKSTVMATPMGFEEAKEKLKAAKTPLPKSEEKFTNYCKNMFKIEESKTVKQLWKFMQENK